MPAGLMLSSPLMLGLTSYWSPLHRFVCCSKPAMGQQFAAARRSSKAQPRSATALQAVSPMEVAQIANEGGFIAGVAGVMVGIVLVVSCGAASMQQCTSSCARHPPPPRPHCHRPRVLAGPGLWLRLAARGVPG